jgi:hypothetical protein
VVGGVAERREQPRRGDLCVDLGLVSVLHPDDFAIVERAVVLLRRPTRSVRYETGAHLVLRQ